MFLLTFLLIYSLLYQSQSIPNTCITCTNCQDLYDGTDSNSTCSISTPDADSCQKTRIQLPGSTLILKSCAKNCQEQSMIAGPFRLDITCCTTDDCNQAKTLEIQSLIFNFFLVCILIYLY